MSQRIAIVSGGSRGIGLAITIQLLKEGYKVIIADLADSVKDSEKLKDPNCYWHSCNITNSSQVQELFQKTIKDHGKIDLLVNNAGIIKDNLIDKMPEEDFDAVVNVNLKGTWLMCKEAAKYMRVQNSGKIVNIASRAWLGNRGQSNYAASKAGVISLSRVLALELGKYNICVNVVAPGLIDTPLTRNLKPEVLESLINAQPTKKIGQPEDVARAVAFLGSEATHFITGQVLYVDGGKSIGSNMI